MTFVFDCRNFTRDVIRAALEEDAMQGWVFSLDNAGHLSLFNPDMNVDEQMETLCAVDEAIRRKLDLDFHVSLSELGQDTTETAVYPVRNVRCSELLAFSEDVCFCWMDTKDEERLMNDGRYLAVSMAASL